MKNTKHKNSAAWSALLMGCLQAVAGHAATVEAGPPPKLMGCTLGLDFTAFGDCVVGKSNDKIDDAVADATTQLNSQKASLAQQLQNAQAQLQRPLVQAMSQLQSDQLMSCLASRGINFPATVASAAANPTQFVQARLASLWQKGMSMSGQLLAPRLTTLRADAPPPTPAELVNLADQMFVQLVAQDPAGQCIAEVLAPFRAQARAMATSLYPAVKGQYDAMIHQTVRPAVNQAMVALLAPTMRQLVGAANAAAQAGGTAVRGAVSAASGAVPEDVQKIALAVTLKYLLDPTRMAQLTSEVNRLATTLQTNPAGAATVAASLDRAATSLSTWNDQIALEVGIATLRFYGHRAIDTHGKDVVSLGFAAASALKDVVAGIITSIVGLSYEPGEAVGKYIATAIEVTLDAVEPPAQVAMNKTAHEQFDRVVDLAYQALRERRPPSYYLQNAGELGELLKHFPTENELLRIAVPQLETLRLSLFNYHESVGNLARAANGARR